MIFIWPLFVFSGSETGCISGRYWNHGELRYDYSVTLEPGGVSTQSDSNGVYCFPDLSPGWYSVSIREDSIKVLAGDTTFADKAANGWDWWESITENYQYELQFRIVAEEKVSLDGFVMYGSMRGLNRLPFRCVNDSIIAVQTPAGEFDFVWSLPSYPEQRITLRDCPSVRNGVNELYMPSEFDPPWVWELQYFEHIDTSNYPLTAADREMYQWCRDDLQLTHRVFNPRNIDGVYECVSTGISFPDDIDWRMWTVFKDRIVTVDSSGRIRRCRVSDPVCSPFMSPSALRSVVIVREPWGSREQFRMYRVDMEREVISEFDPFPDLDIQAETAMMTAFETRMPNARAYPADDGSVILKFGGVMERLCTYDTDGEPVQDHQFISTNVRNISTSGSHLLWLVFSASNREEPVFYLGDTEENTAFVLGGSVPDPYLQPQLSPSGRYLVLIGRTEGVWLFDISEHSLRELPVSGSAWRRPVVFSADESVLACQVDNTCPTYAVEVYSGTTETCLFDLRDESIPCITRFSDFSLVYRGEPMAVSSRGWTLMKLWERNVTQQNRIRVALMDSEGNLAWLSHYVNTDSHFFGVFDRWGCFSPGGDLCAFSDGDQLHLLTIEDRE